MPYQWTIQITLEIEGDATTMATRRDDLKTQLTTYKSGKPDIKNASMSVASKGFVQEDIPIP